MDTAKLVAATLQDGRDARALAGMRKVGRRPLPLVWPADHLRKRAPRRRRLAIFTMR